MGSSSPKKKWNQNIVRLTRPFWQWIPFAEILCVVLFLISFFGTMWFVLGPRWENERRAAAAMKLILENGERQRADRQ